MNAFSLMAHHMPRIDYTIYCNESYANHLDKILSEIERNNGIFIDPEPRSLEDSALVRRIERIYQRSMFNLPLELVVIPGSDKKENAIKLLQSLYRIEEGYTKERTHNLFPELAELDQCAKQEHVNIIAFITLGKLSRTLELQWEYLNVGDAFSRLCQYMLVYHSLISQHWPLKQHYPFPLQDPRRGILLPNYIHGAGGTTLPIRGISTTMPIRGFKFTNTSTPNVPTASSTVAQEIDTTPSTPSTTSMPDTAPWGDNFTKSATHDDSVITDIDFDGSDGSDGSFDHVSYYEDLE